MRLKLLQLFVLVVFVFSLQATFLFAQSTDYLCGGRGCNFEVLSGNSNTSPDTLVIFSGASSVDYNIPISTYLPKNYAGDKTALLYTVENQENLGTSTSMITLFRVNTLGKLLLWDPAFLRAGEEYRVGISYADEKNPNLTLGIDTLVLQIDTAAPKFNYNKIVDTIFLGNLFTGADATLAEAINVVGADTIRFRYNSQTFVPDPVFPSSTPDYSWISLNDTTGALTMVSRPTQLGTFTFEVRAFRRSSTDLRTPPQANNPPKIVEEIRLDDLGLDSYTIVVVDSPTIEYRDIVIVAGSADGFTVPVVDLKGIEYTFDIQSISGMAGIAAPNTSSYSIDATNGAFSWLQNDFTERMNAFVFTLTASTSRYGGKTVTRELNINVIDTPLVTYPSSTVDYEQNYDPTSSDSILVPTIDWRGDTGIFHLVEVQAGYTNPVTGQFIVAFVKRGNLTSDASLPSASIPGNELVFNSTDGTLRWTRYTDAYEYRFKVVASNDAGISPRLAISPSEDTARFTLIIMPGIPTIAYPKLRDTFIYNVPNQAGSIPVIDWKGIPSSLRISSLELVNFTGSKSSTEYVTDEQGVDRLFVDEFNYLSASSSTGQLRTVGYPQSMRAGTYSVNVSVWSVQDPTRIGSTVDTIVVVPVAPTNLYYGLVYSNPFNYNSLNNWRALYYNFVDYADFLNRVSNGGVEELIRFDGEIIDSAREFSSATSEIVSRFDDGGDTISFNLVTVTNLSGGPSTIFENGFAVNSSNGAFEWSGGADASRGFIHEFDRGLGSVPNPRGIQYQLQIAITNSQGSTNTQFTFEIYRPRPVLQYRTDLFSTVVQGYVLPIDGVRAIDTVIFPIEWPEQVINTATGATKWFYEPGRDAGLSSYLLDIDPADANRLRLDTPLTGPPTLFLSTQDNEPGSFPFNIQAQNSLGVLSILNPAGYRIFIVDTPRNNQYATDTLHLSCGFGQDSNLLSDINTTLERSIRSGYGFTFTSNTTRNVDSRRFEILNISNLDPADWDVLELKYNNIEIPDKNADGSLVQEPDRGKIYINESKDGNRVFTPNVEYKVTVKVSNELTRGENNLPARVDAYDTAVFVFILDASLPNIEYGSNFAETVFNQGGSVTPSVLDWFCDEGSVFLFDEFGKTPNPLITIEATTGVITWDKTLQIGTYNLFAVASNVAASDTFRLSIKINVAPPENYTYTPNQVVVSFGTSGSSNKPTIVWNNNKGNFSLPLESNLLKDNKVGINTVTGVITWSDELLVGVYNLAPIAVNAGGQTSTTFQLTVELTKPSIEYVPSSATTLSGQSDSSAIPTTFTGGGTLTYQLLDEVMGISVSAEGRIIWSNTVVAGTYNLQILVSNGLLDDTATYKLNINDGALAPFDEDPNNIKDEYIIFPNPVTQNAEVTLRFGILEPSVVTIRLLNLHGQPVLKLLEKSFIILGTYEKSFSLTGLIPGIYILEVKKENDTHRRRLVITE